MTEIDISTREAPAHGGRRHVAQQLYGIPKEELLDFSASINFLGPPPAALSAIRAAAGEVAHYPEEDPSALKIAIATHLGVFPDEVALGNGSIEIIYWLASVLRPRRVLIIEPTFSEYRRACEAAGAVCESFWLSGVEGFALDTGRINPAGYDLVFVCNPNNPTGYLVPLDEMISLWKRCRDAGAGLVVDEAFIDFSGGEESVLSWGVSAGLYSVRSFTKFFALAGLRLGCLAAPEDFIVRLKQCMPPWNVNAFALAAGVAAIGDLKYMARTWREVISLRDGLYKDLEAIPGIEPFPSEANFLLCRVGGDGAAALAERLGRVGILIRDCRSFPGLGDSYIRVAVRSERENYQLVTAIRKLMGEKRNIVPSPSAGEKK